MRYVPLFFLFALLACMPKAQDPEPLCEISLLSTVEEALKNPMFEVGSWPGENWWECFGDAALNSMIQEALNRNPGYLAAKEEVEELAEEAKVVYASLFPTLNLNADLLWAYLGKNSSPISGVSLPHNIHPSTIFFSLNYEFDFWGKNRQKFEAALGQVKTQEALYAEAKLMLSVSVATIYFDLQAALEQYDLYLEMLDVEGKLLELMTKQLEHGLINQISVNNIQENMIETEKGTIILEKEIALKKHALQVLMGRQVQEDFSIEPVSFGEVTVANLPEFIGSDLLARRPDIMAQIWQVRSAARWVGVAKTEFLPNINLGAGGGFFSFHFHDLFSKDSLMGFLLPSFELPIFTAGKLTANLKAKIATYHQTIQEYNNLVLSAIGQVADQISSFQSISQRVEEQQSKQALVRQDMNLTGLRVDAGLDPLTNYLQVKNRYLQEKAALIDLQRSQIITQVELIKALGGGYFVEEDLCASQE